MRKIWKKNKQEVFVFLAIVLLALVIGSQNRVFFTPANFADILRNMIINGIFAFAIMLGIIIGGIDISFPATAVCSMYITSRLAAAVGYSGPVALLFLMSIAIGLVLGLLNGFIITTFRLPAFIVTLGTSNLFYGLLISILGGAQVDRLVPPMERLSKMALATIRSEGAVSSIPVTLIFLVLVLAVSWFILNRTMLGRMIYAIGGDRESAEKAGFPVRRVTVFVYAYIGAVAGLAGMCQTIQARACYPTDLMGGEMFVIAAVVLGGTTISGGRGTVLGTFLGLFLLTMAKSSLILMGIPATWQTFAVGVIILAGTGISAYQVLRDSRRLAPVMESDKPAGGRAAEKKGG